MLANATREFLIGSGVGINDSNTRTYLTVMTTGNSATRITGLAQITHYEVTFDYTSYTIAVRECAEETNDRIDLIADFEMSMTITFNDKHQLSHWMKDSVFTAMQESWQAGENDCYFQYVPDDRVAFMILNGSAALIPVKNLEHSPS